VVVDQRFWVRLRSPQSAAVAGIAFAVLLTAAMLLLRSSTGGPASDPNGWIGDESRRRMVGWAISLVPFAGIAFLWFIAVIRQRLGAREDKLFATVFLGSGLLFVAMLFSAAAVTGGLLTLAAQPQGVDQATTRLAGALTSALLATFGARMAAVFVLVVTTLGRKTEIIPQWLAVGGYGCAVLLLFSPPSTALLHLAFPLWVLVVSVHALVTPGPTWSPADAEPTTGSR